MPRRRKRERREKRWLDILREDMVKIGAMEGDELDPVKSNRITRYGDPEKRAAERIRCLHFLP